MVRRGRRSSLLRATFGPSGGEPRFARASRQSARGYRRLPFGSTAGQGHWRKVAALCGYLALALFSDRAGGLRYCPERFQVVATPRVVLRVVALESHS